MTCRRLIKGERAPLACIRTVTTTKLSEMVIEHTTERINRASLRERRDEVERLLVTRGLARGPRRLLPRTPPVADYQADHISRLREVLESLGPVFSSFGLYLASRIDLLSSRDCLELAKIQDIAEPSPLDVVHALIQREIGRPVGEVFLFFEESPFESRLLFQKHHARLRDGRKVTIKIVRAETEEQLLEDLELLALLRFALNSITSHLAIEGAIDDFRFMLLRKIDLTHEANALALLNQNSASFGILSTVSVAQALCTPRMLTVECLPGVSLRELLAHSSSNGPFSNDDIARRLCVLWLRQALHEGVVPVEISADVLVVLPGRQIGVTGGAFANLSLESKSNLWSYLIATAGESPNQACAFLIKELKRSGSFDNDSELQQKFRQVVPFRDTDWGDNFFPNHLFLQWRLATEHGYLAQPGIPSFFRGLFTVAQLARQLSPERDAFAQALEDVRLITRVQWLKEMFAPDQLSNQMNTYAALMLELPQRLDQALTLVTEGRAQSGFPALERERERRQNSSVLLVALLLVLGALGLLVQHAGVTADTIKTLVFVVVSAGVLRVAIR